MNRTAFQRVPARLVLGSLSILAKEDTNIEQSLIYEGLDIGAAGIGLIDKRDKEMYYRVNITPEGRLSSAIAAALFPYGNPTIGAGIFSDSDVPLVIHGSDVSMDSYSSAALEKMPELYFHAEKTLLGGATFICLRTSAADWSATTSLVTHADTGGSFADPTLTRAGILTQNYTLTWGSVTGFATAADFYDGLTFQPAVSFQDDKPARYGLYNKRIKTVGGIVRGIPLGATRQNILAALKAQGTGAAHGGSRAAASAASDLVITGSDSSIYLTLKGAALMESKTSWGIGALRQGEVAWMATPTLTAGVRGAYFTVLS